MARVIKVPVTYENEKLIYIHRMLSCSKCGYYPLDISIDYCRNCLSKQHFTQKQIEEFE